MDYDTYLEKEYDKYCRETEPVEVHLRNYEEMSDYVLDNDILTNEEFEIAIGFGEEDMKTIENAVWYKYHQNIEDIEIGE